MLSRYQKKLEPKQEWHEGYHEYVPRGELSQQERQVAIEKTGKPHWKLTLIVSAIGVLVPIYHFFFYAPHKEVIVRESRKNATSYQSEIEQINSVLRYLVDKSKDYDEALTLSSGAKVFRQNSTGSIVNRSIPKLSIATVTVEKANLRPEPDLNSKPIMTVSNGTRLLVESRKGKWNRVMSPSGKLAWISLDVVEVGEK